jgi:MFS family permease
MADAPPLTPRRVRLPPSLWALGVTSLFMDASSELVYSLLPVYLVSLLGTSIATLGFIEGAAGATASFTRVLSGLASDRLRRRKPIVVAGYGLATLSKVVFPLAGTVGWVAFGRLVDRVGKGIRGSPRDALIADLAPKEARGAAFGLRQALDSVGAILGPALALLFMVLLAGNVRSVLWVGLVPALLSVGVLILFVREPARAVPVAAGDEAAPRPVTFSFGLVRRFDRRYWFVIGLAVVFSLARFSEAFLVLRAQSAGLSATTVPTVMIAMNAVYAAAAYPAGRAADRLDPRALLVAGLTVLVASDLLLALGSSVPWVIAGAALWGAQLALTQGLFSKLVADAAAPDLRGTAFGLFDFANGIAALVASALAGLLWMHVGAAVTFLVGAGFAMVVTTALLVSIVRNSSAGAT